MLYNEENVTEGERVYSIGELAELGEISVRTLRYYDEINLLEPTEVRKGGRRFYDDTAFMNLQYIITLKEIGFELIDIKAILRETNQNPRDLLEKRLEIIEQKENQLKIAKSKVQAAIHLYDLGDYKNLEELFGNLEQFKQTKEEIDETKKVLFTDEEREVLSNLPKVGDDTPIVNKWTELLRDIKQAINKGIPARSEEGIELAKRSALKSKNSSR